MVCPRCITAVESILHRFNLSIVSVSLGEATVAEDIDGNIRTALGAELDAIGFELLDSPRSIIVENIKTAVIEWVRITDSRPKLSEWIASHINKEYSVLSKIFSEVCGITIERFCIQQRIEYAKELICYHEMSTSEIAWTLGYSSPAHLSAQFKQETGMSPREFRLLEGAASSRRFIDGL